MRNFVLAAFQKIWRFICSLKIIAVLGAAIFAGVFLAAAAPADVSRGVSWLQSQISSAGVLVVESKTASIQQTQCETAITLLQLVGVNPQLASLVGAMQRAGNSSSITESLACTQLLTQRLGLVASNDGVLAQLRLADGSYKSFSDLDVGNALFHFYSISVLIYL